MQGDRPGVTGNGFSDDRPPMGLDLPELLSSLPVGILLHTGQNVANWVEISHGSGYDWL